MALYAFDGTGNEDEERDDARQQRRRLLQRLHRSEEERRSGQGDRQPVHEGHRHVGPRRFFGTGRRRRSGSADTGGSDRRWNGSRTTSTPATTNVDIVGFSRGAAIAMSFANEIASKLPDVEIRFVGVFDVVAQFGLPGRHINAGHVVSLPRNVKCCRHAMAMDESRALFPLTRLCDKDGSARRSARRVVVPRRAFRHRRRQRQSRPQLDRAELDVHERAARRAADSRRGRSTGTCRIAACRSRSAITRSTRKSSGSSSPTDCLHSSVVLGSASPDGRTTIRRSSLTRINDEGRCHEADCVSASF